MVKRALITGVTGMVGSHLCDYLLANTDWEIHGMCRWRSPLENIEHLIPLVNEGNRLTLVYGDLRDEISLINVLGRARYDYIFHLAAQSYPQTSFTSPIETFDTNVSGTARLLEAVRLTHKDFQEGPIVHVCASSEVFGRVPKDQVPISENVQFHPASPYAISKVGTDLIGRYYAEAFGLTVMTTRMFTHTGPRRGDVFAESTFAKQIALIERGMIPPVVKVGNLMSMRTWADVRDAVKAYFMLVTVDPRKGEYYNIGGDYSCTVGEMLDFLIARSTHKDIRVEVDKERLRPIDADLQIPDTSKFRRHTGWKPEIPFEKTMCDLLDFWRNRVERGNPFPCNR